MTNPVIFAYSFDSEGKAAKLSNKEVAQELENNGLAWVHLDANSKTVNKWLQSKVNYLDHLIINALTAEETRPRVMEFETGLLIILRGINLNKNSEPEDMVSVRVWVDAERIIPIPVYAIS